MDSLKHSIILITLVFFLPVMKSQDPCANKLSETQCRDKPIVDLPLFQGRCCWTKTNKSCTYIEASEIMNIFKLIKKEMTCGTNMEECIKIDSVPSKAYDNCYSIHTEIPFKCCYIRVGPKSFCYPLDVSNNEIYSIFEYKLRAKENDDDPYVEIFCKSYIINSSISFIVLFFIIFIN